MIVTYLESIKYIGHLWPVALMRIFIGTLYTRMALHRIQDGYLDEPYLGEKMGLGLDSVTSGGPYYEFLQSFIQNQWYSASMALIALELLIGASYFVGYGVRISAAVALILSMHSYLFFDPTGVEAQFYLFCIHLLFLLLGAGRCLGLDYYFYKSRRGILW